MATQPDFAPQALSATAINGQMTGEFSKFLWNWIDARKIHVRGNLISISYAPSGKYACAPSTFLPITTLSSSVALGDEDKPATEQSMRHVYMLKFHEKKQEYWNEMLSGNPSLRSDSPEATKAWWHFLDKRLGNEWNTETGAMRKAEMTLCVFIFSSTETEDVMCKIFPTLNDWELQKLSDTNEKKISVLIPNEIFYYHWNNYLSNLNGIGGYPMTRT